MHHDVANPYSSFYPVVLAGIYFQLNSRLILTKRKIGFWFLFQLMFRRPNLFNEKAFIPSTTSHVIICCFSTCCSNMKYFLSMFSDGNSKLTWQSDCAMWLLCLEVVRGHLSLGLGSVALLLFVFLLFGHKACLCLSTQAIPMISTSSVSFQCWIQFNNGSNLGIRRKASRGLMIDLVWSSNCLLLLTSICSWLYEKFFFSRCMLCVHT